MITFFLIVLVVSSMVVLFPYVVGYIFAFFTKEGERKEINRSLHNSVSVLVPSHFEWQGLVDCILSLLHQEYKGELKIHILLNDNTDNSSKYLEQKWWLNENGDMIQEENKQVILHYTWVSAKKDKINTVIETLNEEYIWFLDADHRAEKDRISSSVTMLDKSDAIAVQSRRAPMSVRNFFQVRDSLQNHLWNEMLNNMYQRWWLTSFFTGTTAIFRNDKEIEFRMWESLTEDTYLSYELIVWWKHILYNSQYGSYEEVSPDYMSYFNRRRRWSHGHTQTMINYMKAVWNSSKGTMQKIVLSYHSFYFASVTLLLTMFSVFWARYFLQFPEFWKRSILVITAVLAWVISRFHNRQKLHVADFVISIINIFPRVSIWAVWWARFIHTELFQTISSFPYENIILSYGVLVLIVAYMPVIKWSILRGKPTLFQAVSHWIFYPLVLLMDIFAFTSWIGDLMLWRKTWNKIKRTEAVDQDLVDILPVSEETRVVKRKIVTWVVVILLALVWLVWVNDFFPRSECWQKTYLLWDYVVFNRWFDIEHSLERTKEWYDENSLVVKVLAQVDTHKSFNKNNDQWLLVSYKIDGEQVHQENLTKEQSEVTFEKRFPMWRDKKMLEVEVSADKFSCKQKYPFTTVLHEIKWREYFVNSEPFLVKGIIPSFSHSRVEPEDAYSQIKLAWANAVRLYHSPSDEVLNLLEELELMLMSQPDSSTWSNVNITSDRQRKKLVERYQKLAFKTNWFPYSLFVALGNEIELSSSNREKNITAISKTLEEIIQSGKKSFPLAYSTYLTYISYPTDIEAINMLDTGKTYRKKALQLVAKRNKPILASEFGGFVAMWEKDLTTEVRAHRMYVYFNDLLKNWGIWAMFFQSHDDWWQPVVRGYNDPFSPNLPDDVRWYRDRDNTPKKELIHLKNIFADLQFGISSTWNLRIENRRKYGLHGIDLSIFDGDKVHKVSYEQLKPWQIYETNILLKKEKYNYELWYVTHKWLHHSVQHEFDLRWSHIWDGSPIQEISLNAWYREEGEDRKKMKYGQVPKQWWVEVMIQLPHDLQENDSLVLSGIWADQIEINQEWENAKTYLFNTHPYRDIMLNLKDLWEGINVAKPFVVSIERSDTTYISKHSYAADSDVFIDFELPVLYRFQEEEIK